MSYWNNSASYGDFITAINRMRDIQRNGPEFPKLYMKREAYEICLKHHILDDYPADRIVILPDSAVWEGNVRFRKE